MDHHICTGTQEVLVVHRNALLTETGRLRLARCVVEDGWPLRRAAERFQVSPTTTARWAGRYRQHGAAGMADRSSRPCTSPARTEQRIVRLRVRRQLGPAQIALRLGLNPSTAHKVLTRYGCPPLTCLDRGTGAPVRRYERSAPGELVHVDVKKLGNIPDGGGWRTAGRTQGQRNRAASPAARRERASPGARQPDQASDDLTAPPWQHRTTGRRRGDCLRSPRCGVPHHQAVAPA